MKKVIFLLAIIFIFFQNNIIFAGNISVSEKIFNLKYQNDRKDDKQKLLETNILNDLNNSLIKPRNDSFIYNITSFDRILIITNNKFEFVDGNDIKRIIFTKYYDIKELNLDFFINKKGLIINKTGTNEFFFVENYKTEIKIPYSKMSKYTKGYITEDSKYIFESGIYYSYIFDNSLYFLDEKYGLYIDPKLDISNSILYKNLDEKYSFVKNYKKVKVISSNVIESLTGKYSFLKELTDDVIAPGFKKNIIKDYDEDFKKLKKEVYNLTNGLEKDEKIRKIYDWILNNISYSKKVDFANKDIFSGIDSYKSKVGVCTAYTKLFLYMLSFAGIDDVEVIRGDVIDALDFPTIGHAWVRVGNYYYDPTFDDPVGLERTKSFNEYKYYKLPKDIFYTNRYDYKKTPSILKNTTLEYRKNIVKKIFLH